MKTSSSKHQHPPPCKITIWMCANCCWPFNCAPDCLPTSAADQEQGQPQILLQAARAAMARSSLVREARSSLGKLDGSIIRPLTKPDLYAASPEPDNMRNSRPQLKSMVLYQGIALPGLRKVLRHQLCKKAGHTIQDSPFPELARTAEPLEGRLNSKSWGQIREMIWGKAQMIE